MLVVLTVATTLAHASGTSAGRGGGVPYAMSSVQGDGYARVGSEPAAGAPSSDWRSWWFFAILVLLGGAAVYGLCRIQQARLREVERLRTRIATDLHDDIGSSLTQIAILSEIARSRADASDPSMADLLEKIAATSRELVDSMSDVVWAVNPTEDQLRDLSQRIRRFGTELFESRGIGFRFRAPGSDQNVPMGADERREVYLVFKESVNNAIKHSGCGSVESELTVEDGWLTLRVQDDGHGFDVATESDGHGLASMRARARALGGSFDVASGDDGTTEMLRLPLGRRRGSWRAARPPSGRRGAPSRLPGWSFGLRGSVGQAARRHV